MFDNNITFFFGVLITMLILIIFQMDSEVDDEEVIVNTAVDYTKVRNFE